MVHLTGAYHSAPPLVPPLNFGMVAPNIYRRSAADPRGGGVDMRGCILRFGMVTNAPATPIAAIRIRKTFRS